MGCGSSTRSFAAISAKKSPVVIVSARGDDDVQSGESRATEQLEESPVPLPSQKDETCAQIYDKQKNREQANVDAESSSSSRPAEEEQKDCQIRQQEMKRPESAKPEISQLKNTQEAEMVAEDQNNEPKAVPENGNEVKTVTREPQYEHQREIVSEITPRPESSADNSENRQKTPETPHRSRRTDVMVTPNNSNQLEDKVKPKDLIYHSVLPHTSRQAEASSKSYARSPKIQRLQVSCGFIEDDRTLGGQAEASPTSYARSPKIRKLQVSCGFIDDDDYTRLSGIIPI